MTAPLDSISEDTILSIPSDQPERLFSKEGLKEQYHLLLKRFYGPSTRNEGRANEVITHLKTLYELGTARVVADLWSERNKRIFRALNGTKYEIDYVTTRAFELGTMIIGHKYITYVVHKAYEPQYNNAVKVISGFSYADKSMSDNIKPYLPRIKAKFETAEEFVLVLEKGPDYVLLQDVVHYYQGSLDPRAVAWIASSLHSLACYLNWAGISTNSIYQDNVFISPRGHSVYLSSFWYTTKMGEKLTIVPIKIRDRLPNSILRSKVTDPKIDNALLKATCRSTLSLSGYCVDKEKAEKLIKWLQIPSKGDPTEDYYDWELWRDIIFGPRKFIEMPVTFKDIYPTI